MIDIDECSLGTNNCDVNAICTNTIGSFECKCKPGYIGNGTECFACNENEYSFNDTTCLSCPENSERMLKWKSILDCKCSSFNHYPDDQTLTCIPCDYGFKVDDLSNTCQSTFFFLSFFLSFFLFFYTSFLLNK